MEQNNPRGLEAGEQRLEERQADGSDVTGGVRAALEQITSRPDRDDATGRFIAGAQPHAKTFERSEAFWSAVAPAKRELVERIHSDLAVDGSTATTLVGLIDAYVEARLFRTAMFIRLGDLGGPVTTKGKSRALYSAYLAALDRETRLAQV